MKLYKLGGIELFIKLNNGVYFFADESATGKTRIYHLLKDMMMDGQNVYAFSYCDKYNGVDLLDILKNRKIDLLLLDRYNMYHTAAISRKLHEMSSNTVIMIDSKLGLPDFDFDTYVCGIEWKKRGRNIHLLRHKESFI